MDTWQMDQAKAHFGKLIGRARQRGPQLITRHDAEKVVVISVEENRKLTRDKPSFKAHLLGTPKVDNLQIERQPDSQKGG